MPNIPVQYEGTQLGVIPLSKNPVSDDDAQLFTETTKDLAEISSVEKPGTLSIQNITYKTYQSQELESKVPNEAITLSNTTQEDGAQVTYNYTASVIPTDFSQEELTNLADILKTLAQQSHTHTATSPDIIKEYDVAVTAEDPDGTLISDPGFPEPIVKCNNCTNHGNNGNNGNNCNWW